MLDKKYYIVDDIISDNDLFNLYTDLIKSNVWYLARATNGSTVGQWAGFIVHDNDTVMNPYWFGRFVGLFENIKHNFEKKYKFSLPSKIRRMHVGAKHTGSNTDFHTDVSEPFTYTIVGFATPEWSSKWGGELNIEGELIDFKPGRFVIFKSDLRHDGTKIKGETNHWKLSLNYVIKQ
jgi:hypothetical protein